MLAGKLLQEWCFGFWVDISCPGKCKSVLGLSTNELVILPSTPLPPPPFSMQSRYEIAGVSLQIPAWLHEHLYNCVAAPLER